MSTRDVSQYGAYIASALDALSLEVGCDHDAQLIARRADEWRAEALTTTHGTEDRDG